MILLLSNVQHAFGWAGGGGNGGSGAEICSLYKLTCTPFITENMSIIMPSLLILSAMTFS